MNKKWKKSAQRFFALFLCVAMLLPMFPQVVRAEGAATGVVLGDGIAAGGSLAKTTKTGSKAIKLTRIGNKLYQSNRVALMSNAYGYIMSYDPVSTTSTANKANSLRENANGSSENTYYTDTSGNVYIDHSDRDNALWILKQYQNVYNPDATPADGAKLVTSNDGTTQNAYFGYTYSNAFDQTGRNYPGIEMQKGVTDGTNTTIINPFWSCTTSTSNQKRWLEVYQTADSTIPYLNGGISNTLHGTNTRSRYRCEYIKETDGTYTYMLYYYHSDLKFSVLYCDAYGNWGVKYYEGTSFADVQAQVAANYDIHKLRLYKYTEETAVKSVYISGYNTYVLDKTKTWTQAQVLDYIVDNTTVTDPNRKNQYIPYGGSTAKVGYYSITPSGTTAAGTYTIKYKDDAGTTHTLGSVTVSTAAVGTTLSASKGITSLNSPFKYEVMGAAEQGTEYVATQDKVTFTFGSLTIPVTAGMLYIVKNNTTTQFSTKTADQTTGTSVTVKFSGTTVGTMTMYVADSTLKAQLPQYPAAGSVYSYKGSDTTQQNFNTNGTAKIELSTAATPDKTPVDLIIMVDLSSSMRYDLNPDEGEKLYYYEPRYSADGTKNSNWNKASYDSKSHLWSETRMYAMEESLKSMIKSLQATGLDVNIAISDFGDLDHYEFPGTRLSSFYPLYPHLESDTDNILTSNGGKEFSNHLNFVLGRGDVDNDPSGSKNWVSQPYSLHTWKYFSTSTLNTEGVCADFQHKQKPTIYTNSTTSQSTTKTISANVFADVSAMDDTYLDWLIDRLRYTNSKMIGTNYDVGLEYLYKIAYARRAYNLANGNDRDIICVFMSDGAAMQYNYFSGRSISEAWSQYLVGNTDEILTNFVGSTSTDWAKDGITTDKDSAAGSWIQSYANDASNFTKLNGTVQYLMSLFHQHLSNGILINPESGTKFKKCDCQYGNSQTDWGSTFFGCIASRVSAPDKADWQMLMRIHAANNNSTANSSLYNTLNGKGLATREQLVQNLTVPTDDQQYQTYSPYYYFYNKEGKNWWAEAIKGTIGKTYPVINKYANGSYTIGGTTYSDPLTSYSGEVKNNYSTGTGLALDGKDYISGYTGLGLDLYTIGFSLATENQISLDEAETVLKNIANSANYYYAAGSANQLNEALQSIVENTTIGASLGYVEDQLGDGYQLWEHGKTTSYIYVKKYTTSGVDSNGKPIRVGDPEIVETITITHDATNGTITEAFSSLKGSTSILSNGVINGQYVKYNTTTSTKGINLDADADNDWQLKPETFFWIVGAIPEEEMVLEYNVYLTGSMQGDITVNTMRATYDTNNYANLNYTDALGNEIKIDLDTPSFQWGDWTEIKVVIDYGIPVNIAVLSSGNYTSQYEDTFAATISGIAKKSDLSTMTTGTLTGSFGKLTYSGNNVCYTVSSMNMKSYESFVAQVNRTSDNKKFYCAIYVIPATTMYFEEYFVTYSSGNATSSKWWSGASNAGSYVQEDDRVGVADTTQNVYGSDSTYESFPQYSLGNKKTFTAYKNKGETNPYGVAQFTFTGTGFDVISLTNARTSAIVVQVFKGTSASGTAVKTEFVDTFYGYKYSDGTWVPSDSGTDLYQVPVMKIKNLDYGQYTAKITIAYNEAFYPYYDTKNDIYFHLDAIRIYNPADTGVNDNGTSVDTTDDDTFIRDAYLADGEAYPVYTEVRDMLINANDFDAMSPADTTSAAIFLDNTASATGKSYSISDYKAFGPNNEVYLYSNKAVMFKLTPNTSLDEVHIAFRSLGINAGNSATTGIKSKVRIQALTTCDSSGQWSWSGSAKDYTINTATDCYVNITSILPKNEDGTFKETVIVIKNNAKSTDTTDNALVSITNIKTTYKKALASDAASNLGASTFSFNREALLQALAAMNAAEESNQPEQNVPEQENPGQNQPEQENPEQNNPEQENPGTEVNPGSGDVELNAVALMLVTATIMMLAVLTITYSRKKTVK